MVKWRVYIEFVYSPFSLCPFLFFFLPTAAGDGDGDGGVSSSSPSLWFRQKSIPFEATPLRFREREKALHCISKLHLGCVFAWSFRDFYMQSPKSIKTAPVSSVLSEMPYINGSTI